MAVTACPLDCPDTCSIEVSERDGQLSVTAAPGNPFTAGFICQKVSRFGRRVYAPERVRTPLIRTGAKGAGEFREATWDEAIATVVARLRSAASEHGPSAVLAYRYNSSTGVLARAGLSARLWRRFGASDAAVTICAATADAAWTSLFGSMLSADPVDVIDSRLVVVWGANPAVTNTHWPPLVNQARKRGAALVVVDPRRTPMAARADHHLAMRPGTDVVAALAMASHVDREGMIDNDFCAAHATGVDTYLEAAHEWTLAAAAETCGVPAADLATVAELWATSQPVFVRPGWGLERSRNGGSAWKAVLALAVLTGSFGRPGAGVYASLSAAGHLNPTAGDPEATTAFPQRRQVNMNRLGPALCGDLDGAPVTVLFVQGANPAVMNPDQLSVLQGLRRDDLFTVVHDQVLTDTARFADVVLPATTHLEADDVAKSYGSFTLQRMVPVIDRVGQSRTNDEVSRAIADGLGYPAELYDPAPETGIAGVVIDGEGCSGARVLRQPGTTVQFRDTFPSFSDGRARLEDPDGELPLPRFQPLTSMSDGPLTLISPATNRTINSMLAEFNAPEAVVRLSPVDADARKIASGDRVRVFDHRASLELQAVVDDALRPGVCSIPKGLWRRHTDGEITANAFVPSTISDLAGGACFNDARVDVSRVI